MLAHFNAIWKFRHFWMSLVKMDLMTRYRKSVLGIGWSLLQPVMMTAILTLVFSQIGPRGQTVETGWQHYSVMTFIAMTVYGFLRDSALHGCHCLSRNESYIRQTPLPFSIYSMRTVLGLTIHFLITVVVLLAMALGFESMGYLNQGQLSNCIWMILPMLPLIVICGWALATIAGFATVYFNDVSHILEIGAQMFFFLTPVIYERKVLIGEDGSRAWLVDYNPAAAFIETFQKPLVYHEPATVLAYSLAIGTTAFLVLVACLMIRYLSKRVIFHM